MLINATKHTFVLFMWLLAWVVADAANSATGNNIEILDCVPGGAMTVTAAYKVGAVNSGGAIAKTGIVENSTTAIPVGATRNLSTSGIDTTANAIFLPLFGDNKFQEMESNSNNAGTSTFNSGGTSAVMTATVND